MKMTQSRKTKSACRKKGEAQWDANVAAYLMGAEMSEKENESTA